MFKLCTQRAVNHTKTASWVSWTDSNANNATRTHTCMQLFYRQEVILAHLLQYMVDVYSIWIMDG